MTKWVVFGAAVISLFSGCASMRNEAYMRDGVQYGVTSGTFRGRWWSYYERGASYLGGQYYDEAIADFETALQNRTEDSWRARTYGLHFVSYFPNRELGIAYYQQGRYTEAAETLEDALEMVDTARGQHYLALTKKALLAAGVLQDNNEPDLAASMAETVLVAEPVAPIEINASDDLGVAEVRLNDEPLPQRAPVCDVDFKEELKLDEGVHEVTVAVTDLADKQTEKKIEVTVDLTGPTIGLFTPAYPLVVQDVLFSIEGVCVDANGVTLVSVDENNIAESADAAKLPFQTQVTLEPGENTFIILARDRAGNETTSMLSVFQGDPDGAAANAWLLKKRRPDLLMMAKAGGAAALPDAPDAEDRIVLKSPRPDKPNRHNRTVRVAGEVTVASGVSSLSINDQPFDQLTGAPKEIFSRRVPIDDPTLLASGGKMTVAVVAESKDGKQFEESREVELRPISLNTEVSRMPVSVVASQKEGTDAKTGQLLCTELIQGLLKKERFNIVEREQLQMILTEQQLSAELANPASKLVEGQMVAAKAYLVGEAYPQKDKKGCEIKVGVVDTESGLIVAVEDAFIADIHSKEARASATAALANQLAAVYPRLSGELVLVREKGGKTELYFDWTRDDGVRSGMYALIVYEEPEERDEETGFVTEGFTEIVGRVRLEDITESGSRARPAQEDVKFEQGMAAITM